MLRSEEAQPIGGDADRAVRCAVYLLRHGSYLVVAGLSTAYTRN